MCVCVVFVHSCDLRCGRVSCRGELVCELVYTLQAEADLLAQNLDKEYAGILGYEDFTESAAAIAFGKDFGKVTDNLVSCEGLYKHMCVCVVG